MSLRDDVNVGLIAISNPRAKEKLSLNAQGECSVPMPMPPSLIKLDDGKLTVKVAMSRTGRRFSFMSSLGQLSGQPSQQFYQRMWHYQFYSDQFSGVTLALSPEDNTLVAVYHWVLPTISEADFKALFKGFVGTMLELIREMRELARGERHVKLVHKG